MIDPQYIDLYTYARNNPLRYIDPNGADPKEARNVVIIFTGGHRITNLITGSEPSSGGVDSVQRITPGGSTEGFGESSIDFEAPHIAQRIANDFPKAEVLLAGPDSGDAIFKDLSTNKPDSIIIYGYSRGGKTAVNLAIDLANNSQGVDQLTTVDPYDIPAPDLNIGHSPFIRDAVNFYNSHDLPPDRSIVEGATNIGIGNNDRVPNSNTPVNHNNLDDITAPRVVERIEKTLKHSPTQPTVR